MSTNFYFKLRTQSENLGDYLIAQAMIDLLASFGNLVIDIQDVPELYLKLFIFPENTQLVQAGLIKTIIKSENKSARWIYVVKPGGYPNAKTTSRKIKLLLMGTYFSLIKRVWKIKMIKMPHSFGGALSFADKQYQRTFDLTLCRDASTLETYKAADISNLQLFPDLAMYYVDKQSKFNFSEELQKDTITISLRYDRQTDEPEIALKLAKKLQEQNSINNITFVSQVMFDTELNAKIAAVGSYSNIIYDMTNTSIQTITETYKRSKYIISNRLHALLLGVINGAIPIAIIDTEKDQKILACLEYLNIPWMPKDKILDKISSPKNIDSYNYNFPSKLEQSLHIILNNEHIQ